MALYRFFFAPAVLAVAVLYAHHRPALPAAAFRPAPELRVLPASAVLPAAPPAGPARRPDAAGDRARSRR
jgi:hypothetical protein